ncbi:MAG TPA: TonB-dependent receptor [Xanthomonadaceae bacterium]|jgi:outer membrane receptor protein involved in Fe transport|nr:TonB-dependent receptor [Xanthomonadaceae bacterium]
MSGLLARRCATAAIALALACAVQARADEATQTTPGVTVDAKTPSKPQAKADTPAPKTLAAVKVVGHYANGIRTSDAASEGVILGSLLQDIPLLRPGEVLEAVPGLVVTQHSGEGKANQYFLRGYNLDHGTDFATSVDGVPVNMPTNAHGQGYSDLSFLIPELVSEIDYRKGTYFAQNGDFSSAGSADIHYRDSLDSGIADLTFGSYGYRRMLVADSFPVMLPGRSSAESSGNSGPTLLAAVEGLQNNGPERKDPEGMRKINSLFRLSDGDASNGWSADALGYEAHWNSTDQVPLSLIASGELCRFCALDPTDGGDSARDILSGEWHRHDDDGYTKVSAYAEHYRLQLFSDFTFFELRPATGDQFEQQEARNILGAQFVKGWSHTLFGFDSITEAGLQVRHDNIHVGLWNSEARIPFENVTNSLVSETEAGAYVQNTTTWTSWFRSLVGLRDDNVYMDLTSLTASENNGNAWQGRVSPKLSLIFGPWDKTEFFVDIGNGFHSNDARGVIYKFDATTGGPSSPVPALVGSFGKELGLRTQIVPGLQSSLALWSLDSESELIYNADSAIGSTSPNGASKRHGVEWNNHYVLNNWLFFDADLAWTHARYANENDNGQLGNFIPNAVPKVASLGVTAHDVGAWSGDIKMLYIGKYPLSRDATLVGPSAVVTNLRVQRELNPSAAVSLDVLNLFDRGYYDIAYEQDYKVSPTSPVVPDGVTVHPGQPRECRVTLRVKF